MTRTGRRVAALAIAITALGLLAAAAVVVLRASWDRAPAVHGDVTIDLGDGVPMVFVEIAPGRLDVPEFLGGLGQGYELEIFVPFLVGVHEVTRAQWTAVMAEPAPDSTRGSAHRPVWLSYADTLRFVERLNELVAPDYEATLPTEVQWEYACRAGNPSDTLDLDDPDLFDAMVWHRGNSGVTQVPPTDIPKDLRIPDAWYGEAVQAAATKAPNAWGLYDMLGNAWEWCLPDAPVADSVDEGSAPSMEMAVSRGGSANNSARAVSPRGAGSAPAGNAMYKAGFRVVLMRPPESGSTTR